MKATGATPQSPLSGPTVTLRKIVSHGPSCAGVSTGCVPRTDTKETRWAPTTTDQHR